MIAVSENKGIDSKLNVTFHAMADATRRNILLRLTQGPLKAGIVAEPYKMSLPAVSKHLKVLEKSGLISRKKVGREHHFELEKPAMKELIDWISFYEGFWNEKLDRLDKFLKNS